MNLLRNLWTGLVNLGWMGVIALGIGTTYSYSTNDNSPKHAPKQEQTPQVEQKTFSAPLQQPDRFQNDLEAEAARKRDELAQRRWIKEKADAEEAAKPEPPVVWEKVVYASATPNLHETHEVGEPYPYSLARLQNNELRWTINEFRWRLGKHMEIGRQFWDLSDIDGPKLNAPLPRNIEDLRKQNWTLSWRASRLADMMAGQMPQPNWIEPSMPSGITQVPIPRPSCNGDFCRVPPN